MMSAPVAKKQRTMRFPPSLLGEPPHHQQAQPKRDEEDDDSRPLYPEPFEFLVSLLTCAPESIPVTEQGGNLLCYSLKGGVWNDSAPSAATRMIVRACYPDLFNFVSTNWRQRNPAVVTGTAGVGKTFFGLYAARRFFDLDVTVVIWYGSMRFAFSKQETKPSAFPLSASRKNNVETGVSFWLATELSEGETRKLLSSMPNAVVIRDPGTTKNVSILEGLVNFALYNISSGNEGFFESFKKTNLIFKNCVRYMDVWDGLELVDAYLCNCLVKGERAPCVRLLLEGYRRYGGSARVVGMFAVEGLSKLEQPYDDNDSEILEKLDNDVFVEKSIDIVASRQLTNKTDDEIKAKGLVFHRIPHSDRTGFVVRFASNYIARRVMTGTKLAARELLGQVVAALGVECKTQDAYGVLYEPEVHRMITGGNKIACKATLLGVHIPVRDKFPGLLVKNSVDIEVGDSEAIYFPGRSLRNFQFCDANEIPNAYLLPVSTNFPTHDSFKLMKASMFFEGKHAGGVAIDEDLWVLVGFQMTVSGSGEATDKPSHKVRGTNLVAHLDAIKELVKVLNPTVRILDDVVTIFFLPTETTRKMQFMPVLAGDGSELNSKIRNFEGISPQYRVTMEDSYVASLLSNNYEEE